MTITKKTKPRIRRSREESRDLIVKAAIRLFAKSGVAATSFQAIADEIQLSQGAVMHHFPTKDDLFSACFAKVVSNNTQVLQDLVDEKDNARERLVKHFKGTWNWLMKFPNDGSLVTLLYYYATFNPEYSKLHETIRNEARQKIENHLHAGIRESIFNKSMDCAEVATALHDYLLGTLINNATLKLGLGKNPPKKQFDTWINLIDTVTQS